MYINTEVCRNMYHGGRTGRVKYITVQTLWSFFILTRNLSGTYFSIIVKIPKIFRVVAMLAAALI